MNIALNNPSLSLSVDPKCVFVLAAKAPRSLSPLHHISGICPLLYATAHAHRKAEKHFHYEHFFHIVCRPSIYIN